jgi:hypothetical protein
LGKVGVMEEEKRGKAGRRKEGNLEWWKDGIMERWNAGKTRSGMVEDWKDGRTRRGRLKE